MPQVGGLAVHGQVLGHCCEETAEDVGEGVEVVDPVAPEYLDLVIWDDEPIIPIHGADHEDEHVAGDAQVRADGHHEQTQQDLQRDVLADSNFNLSHTRSRRR